MSAVVSKCQSHCRHSFARIEKILVFQHFSSFFFLSPKATSGQDKSFSQLCLFLHCDGTRRAQPDAVRHGGGGGGIQSSGAARSPHSFSLVILLVSSSCPALPFFFVLREAVRGWREAFEQLSRYPRPDGCTAGKTLCEPCARVALFPSLCLSLTRSLSFSPLICHFNLNPITNRRKTTTIYCFLPICQTNSINKLLLVAVAKRQVLQRQPTKRGQEEEEKQKQTNVSVLCVCVCFVCLRVCVCECV